MHAVKNRKAPPASNCEHIVDAVARLLCRANERLHRRARESTAPKKGGRPSRRPPLRLCLSSPSGNRTGWVIRSSLGLLEQLLDLVHRDQLDRAHISERPRTRHCDSAGCRGNVARSVKNGKEVVFTKHPVERLQLAPDALDHLTSCGRPVTRVLDHGCHGLLRVAADQSELAHTRSPPVGW